ncbi:MAG: hypothetical protein NZ898_08790 [Myxococcota bacterium]|nr:hypothetical protein [Myxococcota bacterium]MDW8363930.1 hypothetical protein [Myxococcales bacterium]
MAERVVRLGDAVGAPVPTDTGRCLDTVAGRLCFGGSCTDGPCLAPVEPPAGAHLDPTSGARWRCEGTGLDRRCTAVRAVPWRCDERTCETTMPELPDDGEWECAELSGVVVCRGGEGPAGVRPGPPMPGWICGATRTRDEPRRICVDPWPARVGEGSCRFEHEGGLRRICARDRGAEGESPAPLGARCAREAECAEGLRCVAGRCVLARWPAAECWTGRDCPPGSRCVLASCVRDGP